MLYCSCTAVTAMLAGHLGKWLLPKLFGKLCSFCRVGFSTAWPAAAHLFFFPSGEQASCSLEKWYDPELPGGRSMGRTKPACPAVTISHHSTPHQFSPHPHLTTTHPYHTNVNGNYHTLHCRIVLYYTILYRTIPTLTKTAP